MLTFVMKCGPAGGSTWRVTCGDQDRKLVCHKSVLLSLIVFAALINLLSFSMFMEPPWKNNNNNVSRSRISAVRVSNRTVSSKVPTRSSNSTTGTKALIAPRLDRLWPGVWNIEFPIDRPEICANWSNQPKELNWTAIVVVVSASSNFEQRSIVRETWGRALVDLEHFKLVFFVGRPAQNETRQQALLIEEAKRYSDLVQADFTDRYDHLTLKSVLMLRWITTRCCSAHFLLKVDDDVFVNPGNLERVLDHHAGFRRVIFGHLARRWQPIRDSRSHYFVSKKTWTAPEYPNFVAGPAYVVTVDSARVLLSRVRSVPYFHLEDVYVTGMLAQTAGIRRFNQPGFFNRKFTINPCEQRDVVTGHHFEVDELRAAWDVHRKALHYDEVGDDQQAEADCYETECRAYLLGFCLVHSKVPIDYYRYYYYGGRRSAAT